MENEKFAIFLTIARQLNQKNITPLLMGSVGLEVVTGKEWRAQDLDIHVPGDKRGWQVPSEHSIYNWDKIWSAMSALGYRFVDLHEHGFEKEGLSVEFGIIDTLPSFAGVPLEELELHRQEDVQYYLLNPEQYLKLYEASSKDSYRADKNNHKDIKKIAYLRNLD